MWDAGAGRGAGRVMPGQRRVMQGIRRGGPGRAGVAGRRGEHYPGIGEAGVRRGGDEDILKIVGGNALGFFRRVMG